METLTQIDAREHARRERAWKYEQALNAVTEAKLKIETLSAPSPDDKSLATLKRIMDDANSLDGNITGSLGGLVPVAGVVRTFIYSLAASGYNQVLARVQQRDQALAKAKADLVKAEEAFEEFNS
jgi:hypothetical protein